MVWLDDSEARTVLVYLLAMRGSRPIMRPTSHPANLAQRIIHFCSVYAAFLDTAEPATGIKLIPLLKSFCSILIIIGVVIIPLHFA
jgi:hypothetical protein